MQPNGNIAMMHAAPAVPPVLNPQPKRNRQRSARVPRLETTRLEITDAWLHDSQELSLAEATGTMRVNIETLVRSTLVEIMPDIKDRVRRALAARRQQAAVPIARIAA